MSSPPSSQGPRFRPYASLNHQVTKGRYITSNDPRGYMYVSFPSRQVTSLTLLQSGVRVPLEQPVDYDGH
jgi:hypothetical protein